MPVLNLPPGLQIYRSMRPYTANWRMGNLIRWDGPTLIPVGGWERVPYTSFGSKLRAIHSWVDHTSVQHTAYLCERHCYVDSGSGTLLNITPDGGITPPGTVGLGGYGDDNYGKDEYGTPRTAVDRMSVATPAYTLSNWGSHLVAMTSADGRLLYWDPQATSTKLAAVANAPISNRSFVVTPERFIILFGAGGTPHKFQWCDQENNTNWTVGVNSKAGSFHVEPSAPIMANIVTAGGTLFFTAAGAYIIRYIGLPYVYQYEKVQDCPPPYSPAALVDTPAGVFWGALNGFWLYNGSVASPMACPIWDFVSANIDRNYSRFYANCVNIAPKFEVWYFFSAGRAGTDNYVSYNYKTEIWSMGWMNRICGISRANDPNPIMSDGTKVYKHEMGWSYTGSDTYLPFIDTHTINLDAGARLSTIMQLLPEVRGAADAVKFRFIKSVNPSDATEVLSAAKYIKPDGYVDVRETARDFRIRVDGLNNRMWSLGTIDVDIKLRGKK